VYAHPPENALSSANGPRHKKVPQFGRLLSCRTRIPSRDEILAKPSGKEPAGKHGFDASVDVHRRAQSLVVDAGILRHPPSRPQNLERVIKCTNEALRLCQFASPRRSVLHAAVSPNGSRSEWLLLVVRSPKASFSITAPMSYSQDWPILSGFRLFGYVLGMGLALVRCHHTGSQCSEAITESKSR
jgi:hypothetical protein